ncbi:MAG: MFS transporter, partial [Pseudomonadota bacterium]|nr:MFS transporter [Pseudomonadota bacterium]
VGFALPGLEFSGFDPAAPSEQGRKVLLVIYAFIPVVVKVLVILIVWRFPLTIGVQLALQQRLARRPAT